MTRFARARGSKSSNIKEPETPTSWSELKKGMLMKEEKSNECIKKRASVLKSELKSNKSSEWVSLDGETDNFMKFVKKHMQNKEEGINVEPDSRDFCVKESFQKKRKFANNETGKKKKNNDFSEVDTASNIVHNSSSSQKKKKLNEAKVQVKDCMLSKKKTKKHSNICNVGYVERDNETPINQEKINTTNVSSSPAFVLTGNNEKNQRKENENSKFQKKSRGLKKCNWNTSKVKVEQFAARKSVEGNSVSKADSNSKEFAKEFRKGNRNVASNDFTTTIIVGGEIVRLVKYQGFYITKSDSDRLKELKKKMIGEGIPKGEVENVIKLERRRCEKKLARMKKNVCYHCRKPGHNLSQCPEMADNVHTGTGICYKCGSTEHGAFECKVVQGRNYPFAECFICKEKGHIARECPDNPKGLYPRGGCCKLCGDVTHLKKDCPKQIAENEECTIKLGLIDGRNVDSLDTGNVKVVANRDGKKFKKCIEF